MKLDWWLVVQAFGSGVLLTVLIQTVIERFAARLDIKDTWSVASFSAFASVYFSVIPHLYYIGSRPLPNLINIPVCLTMGVIVMFFLSRLPSEPALPAPALASTTLVSYILASRGWAMRAALVAMTASVLRSGTNFQPTVQ
jgi:hypothetical protein